VAHPWVHYEYRLHRSVPVTHNIYRISFYCVFPPVTKQSDNEPQMCDVTENRFPTVLMFLRIGGVPINTKRSVVLHVTYIQTLQAVAQWLHGNFTHKAQSQCKFYGVFLNIQFDFKLPLAAA
jgi:hypothetical protein